MFSVPHIPQGLDSIDLFTDGTCAFPRELALRFASWAVTNGNVTPVCPRSCDSGLWTFGRGHSNKLQK